jgi:exosortase
LESTAQKSSPRAGESEAGWLGLSPASWVKITVISILMVWLFYTPCLRRLWLKTNPISGEANWGHSVFVPLVGLFYLYLNREELAGAKVQPLLGANFSAARFLGGGIVLVAGVVGSIVVPMVAPASLADFVEYARTAAQGVAGLGLLVLLLDWGLGSLVFGLFVFAYGIYPGKNDWVKDLGMVVTIFGVVLTLCGWQVMRIAWFPILFLICALPWPGLVYSQVAMPLQNLAARVAVGMLNICGVESLQMGTKIVMQRPSGLPRTLNVAEACAGMRSLMTFISVGATMAFLSSRPLWQKIFMTLSAIPIAIFCNVMRVSGQGLLDHYASEKLSEGFAHQFVGMVMLVPAFFLILLVGWMLDQVFIEEVDDPRPGMIKVTRRPKAAGAQPAAPVGSSATAPRRQELAVNPGATASTAEEVS